MTLTLTRPWSNIGTAHCLIILDICSKLFKHPTRDIKDIERTRKWDRQTDGRTDRRTDRQTAELKQYLYPHFIGGDITHRIIVMSIYLYTLISVTWKPCNFFSNLMNWRKFISFSINSCQSQRSAIFYNILTHVWQQKRSWIEI